MAPDTMEVVSVHDVSKVNNNKDGEKNGASTPGPRILEQDPKISLAADPTRYNNNDLRFRAFVFVTRAIRVTINGKKN